MSSDNLFTGLPWVLGYALMMCVALLSPPRIAFAQPPAVGLATPTTAELVWRTRAPMPTERFFLSLVQASNGKLYAIGGANTTSNGLRTVEEFDPAANTWSTKAPMPTGRAHIAAVALNGRIYVIGGTDQRGREVATVEEYNPTTDTWATRAPMPTARHGAAAESGGKIYVIGGSPGSCVRLATVEAYDPVTNTWTTKAPMPTARFGLRAAAYNHKIYAIGGNTACNSPYSLTAANEVYDPATNTWQTLASLPIPREGHGVAASHGLIYSIGGYYQSMLGTDVYDPVADRWTAATPLPTPRDSMGVTATDDGRIFAIGGGKLIPDGWDYTFSTNEEGTIGTDANLTVTKAVLRFVQAVEAEDQVTEETVDEGAAPQCSLDDPAAFHVRGTLELSADSDGIDPLSEPVTLSAGIHTVSIPAGSFGWWNNQGAYGYAGDYNGGRVSILLKEPSGYGETWEYRADFRCVDNSGTSNPITVKLAVGNDRGETEVQLLGTLRYPGN